MRKEIYKVKCPQHIVFGDPMYFERFRGNELNRLTVDYRPSKWACPSRRTPKKGYAMAYPGDSINLAYSTTNTRRGRVGRKTAHPHG